MNGTNFLYGINQMDNDIIEEADFAVTTKITATSKKKLNIRRFASAACFVLIVGVMALAGFTINNIVNPAHPAPGEHFSITSIKGANVLENPKLIASDDGSVMPLLPDKYLQYLKASCVALGTVENISTVSIKDGEYTWCISTFDIEIKDSICNLENSRTVKAVSACRYYGALRDDEFAISEANYDYLSKTEDDGLYVLQKVTDDANWNIGRTKYRVEDYADYYLSAFFECDGEKIQYFSTDIMLDDIRE